MSGRKTIIITGAVRGIGRAIALRFAHSDHKLILTYNSNEAAADSLKSELDKSGVQYTLTKMNLSDLSTINTFCDEVEAENKTIDVLVNNAGITFDGAFQLMDEKDYMRVLDVNLFGPLILTTRLASLLNRQGSDKEMSSVVFISSMAAITGKEGQVPYSTTKGAIIGMTRLLGSRFGRKGTRVNAIAPGFIETDMVRNLDPSFYEHVLKASAIPKIGTPEDVANLVYFLSTDASNYICSQTIRIDGGLLR